MDKKETKYIEIMNIKIAYYEYGKGEKNVLLLHGWGASKDTFLPVIDMMLKLNKNIRVTALDFPGFGESDEPFEAFDTSVYEKITIDFMDKTGITNAILIGHSFGGRISIRIASSRPEIISKVVLVDSAGIKPRRKLSYYFKVWSFKLGKLMMKIRYRGDEYKRKMKKLYKKYGSSDYKSTGSEVMRKTLVQVVNEDLSPLLPKIKAPVLLMWGDCDTDTPLWMAERIEKLVKDCGLVVLKGAGHFSFVEKPNEFSIIVNKFITG